MNRKILAVIIMCFGLMVSVTGCAGVSVDININSDRPGTGSAIIDNDYLKKLEETNSFDALIAENGRLFLDIKCRLKDGSKDEYTLYKDPERYVQESRYGTLIVEDHEAYGYDHAMGNLPFRMLFVDSFDEYAEEMMYTKLYTYFEGEEITSSEIRDGLIYFETVTPTGDVGDLLEYFGYDTDEVDSVSSEYTVDPETDQILECSSYVVIDGEKTLYSVQILDQQPDEYIPDETLLEAFDDPNSRTVTVVTDAGGDNEKEYKQSFKKGCLIRIYPGDDFYLRVYEDRECVHPLEKWDGFRDGTFYVKRKVDYSDRKNWAYYREGEEKEADLFLIAPTVDVKDEFYMSMDDEKTKANFLGALNMERGIYEDETRMFAPYYRQGAMNIYSMTPEEREPYLLYAYDDVAAAFEYYLQNENNGRPIVLAGFSQGADMCYRLLEDYFADEEMQKKLVAVYAIGWPCTEEMVEKFPQIRPATSETDTGVVISFDCEAPEVTDTFITPKGTKAYTINPLSWVTDGTPADKSLNIGACFTDYDANITREDEELCGCYIDEDRGILKVCDVDPADYPAIVPNLPEGAYHIYDYQFFFRNLEENVKKRVEAQTD